VPDVVVVPLGFACDQIEIAYELDVEAQKLCRELDINMVRAETPSSHPLYAAMVRELIEEQLNPSAPRRALGSKGPYRDDCRPKCCRSGLD
jgi:ferrochelatase